MRWGKHKKNTKTREKREREKFVNVTWWKELWHGVRRLIVFPKILCDLGQRLLLSGSLVCKRRI